MNWEGAELYYYINGESHSISLTDTQFAVVVKILGLNITEDGVTAFSDGTLKTLARMKGNPLKLVDAQ